MMEKLLKESFILRFIDFILELIKESFIGKLFSISVYTFEESFIFSLFKSYGVDVSFNLKTGFLNYRGSTFNLILSIFVVLLPLSFFIRDVSVRVVFWVVIYFILYTLLFEEDLVKESFIFKIISGVLS
ncbi:MAG: hypothetical protein J7J33_02290 [Caldisericia bacterium]|nr:hypothetical protein [Caldisericia bacterium]